MVTITLPVTDCSCIAQVRRTAVECARALGFGETDVGRVAIVVTELAGNLVKHARGGEMVIAEFEDANGPGVEVLALDRGPGITDVATCLRDGYSTAGSPGQGLGAVVRLSQVFDIVSSAELGTAILSRLQPNRPEPAAWPDGIVFGAVSVPKPGETVCGDAWCVQRIGDGHSIFVADGLGHGPAAAAAATEAVRLFRRNAGEPPCTILERVHAGMRHTRGAAVAVARLEPRQGRMTFCGVGNIAGSLLIAGQVRRTVSQNGTAGLSAQRIQGFDYPLRTPFVFVMHTDGLASGCSPQRCPGAGAAHPTLLAAVLYRDFARGRDDATVVVASAGE